MNPKHQAWLKVQYPGAKPPGREDVGSVQLWLHQQLQHLLDSHAAADSSHEQHLQQPAQHILASVQPEYLLQQQQHALLSPARPHTSKVSGLKSPEANHTAEGVDAGDSSQAADAAASICEWQNSTGLQAQTSQLLLAARQPGGPLDVARLQQQEALHSAALNELCR
jgi:hypothetical protein